MELSWEWKWKFKGTGSLHSEKTTSNPGLIPVRSHQRKGRGAADCTVTTYLCGGPTLTSHAPSSLGCLYPAESRVFLSDGQQIPQLHAGTYP